MHTCYDKAISLRRTLAIHEHISASRVFAPSIPASTSVHQQSAPLPKALHPGLQRKLISKIKCRQKCVSVENTRRR